MIWAFVKSLNGPIPRPKALYSDYTFAKRETKTLGQFSCFLFGPVGIKLRNEFEILGGRPAFPEYMGITDIADIEFPLGLIEVVQPLEYFYLSGIGSQQPDQALNECRFARTIWPNQTENHTGIEIKIDWTELKILECLHHIFALAGFFHSWSLLEFASYLFHDRADDLVYFLFAEALGERRLDSGFQDFPKPLPGHVFSPIL
jgi:hypothetical protein